MANFVAGYAAQTYAALRIVTGFLFLYHGSQKLFPFPSDGNPNAPLWITCGAGGIEFVGGRW